MVEGSGVYMGPRFIVGILMIFSVSVVNTMTASMIGAGGWMGWMVGCPLGIFLLLFFTQWVHLCGVSSLEAKRKAHFNELDVAATYHTRRRQFVSDEPPTPFEHSGKDTLQSLLPADKLLLKLAKAKNTDVAEKSNDLEPTEKTFEKMRADHYKNEYPGALACMADQDFLDMVEGPSSSDMDLTQKETPEDPQTSEPGQDDLQQLDEPALNQDAIPDEEGVEEAALEPQPTQQLLSQD